MKLPQMGLSHLHEIQAYVSRMLDHSSSIFLEIGSGYSTARIASALPANARMISIETKSAWYQTVKEDVGQSSYADKIELRLCKGMKELEHAIQMIPKYIRGCLIDCANIEWNVRLRPTVAGMVAPLMPSGSHIFLHDADVHRKVEDLLVRQRFKQINKTSDAGFEERPEAIMFHGEKR